MKSIVLFLSIVAIGFIKPYASSAQSRQQDSLALVDLYNSTDGPHWSNNTNWLSNFPIDQWRAVRLTGDRVSQLFLGNNGLNGTLPASLGNLTALTSLNLQGNNLRGAVPAIPNSAAMLIDVRNNLLSFQGMDAIVAAGGRFFYNPQANFPITVSGGTLSASAAGIPSNNSYKWYRNDTLVATKTGDANFTPPVPGNYFVRISNAAAPALILYGSDTTGAVVKDSLALVDLYNSTNGPSWNTSTNWLTGAPLNTWFGVRRNNLKRVSGLDLRNNHLAGTIPSSVGHLFDLTSFQVYNNQLGDSVPNTFSLIPYLDTFNIARNLFQGNIPFTISLLGAFDLSDNRFNFGGLEPFAQRYPSYLFYSPQAALPLHAKDSLLSVSAGGTLSNNRYKWYLDGTLVADRVGDSTFIITHDTGPGNYSVTVANAVATATTLSSETKEILYQAILAPVTTSVSKTFTGTETVDVTDPAHERILTITPTAGGNTLNGDVASMVTIEPAVALFHGQPYVQRHYDVTPAVNPSTAQAIITLYFTQAEFDSYNTYVIVNNLAIPLLPTSGIDNGNLRIMQLHGSFTGNSAPGNYSDNSLVMITPAVAWDARNSWWTVTFPVTGFSGFFISTVNFALPLTLLQFTASHQQGGNLLQWSTAAEINTASFVIERSSNGTAFSEAGTVAASSTTGNHSYRFEDKNYFTGKVYYRLRMTDRDGHYTYSKILALSSGNPITELSVYPNPVHATATVVFTTNIAGKYTVRVTDMGGKTIKTLTLSFVSGANLVSVDMSGYNSGNYLVTVQSDSQQYSKMLHKY